MEGFRAMKMEYTVKLEKLEAKLSDDIEVEDSIETLLNKGIKSLLSLDRRYIEADIEDKRKIIGSMYPEKLRFDGQRLRTNRVNEVAMRICKIDRLLQRKRGRTNGDNSDLSSQVGTTGFEPATPSTPCLYATELRYVPSQREISKNFESQPQPPPTNNIYHWYITT